MHIPLEVECIPFVIYRTIHRYGTTNFIDYAGYSNGYNQAGGEQNIEIRMKNYYVNIQNGAGTVQQTVSPASELMTPIFKQPNGFASGGGGDGITSGNDVGVLNSSSPYPVVYGPSVWAASGSLSQYEGSKSALNRPYGWSFNSVTMNEPYIQEYLNSAVNGDDPNIGSPSGFTMDNSVLGWCSALGAYPETIAIGFPTFEPIASNNTATASKVDLQVILELYPYNPTSGVTGAIFRIPVQCSIEGIQTTLSGKKVTINATP